MKKIIVIITLLLLGSLPISASSWKFVWDTETTIIDVPLGKNISQYINIPKAYLYRDNVKILDANISYNRNGDWLYLLSDVDTTKVGTYQVWYKASESKYQPGQCQGYKTLVTFNVVDQEKPVFKNVPKSLTYFIGGKRPSYEDQITAVDNSGNCKITVDDSLVNYEVPGVYFVSVLASDGINVALEQIELTVEDIAGPIIDFLGENNTIILGKGEEVSLLSYFKAIDKIDGDVTNSISYEQFNTNEVKKFNLEVFFKDKNGNKNSIVVTIDIVDNDEPVIELFSNPLIVEYNKELEPILKNNIKKAYKGKSNIKDFVNIDMNNLKNEVGTYSVKYSYEENDKQFEVACEVKVLSMYAPTLIIENVSIPIGKKINLLDYIQVIDLSDPNIAKKLEFDDTSVDYNSVGTYSVLVSVTNSSNLSTSETLTITIYGEDSANSIQRGKDNKIFYFIGIVIIGLVIAVFVYFRKRRNCNKNQNQL